MFAGVLLALLGAAFAFAVIYVCRLWHAGACGCVACYQFVQLHRLDPLVRLIRRVVPERKP